MKSSKNSIRLKYEEQIYDVEYNDNSYKVSVIEDLDSGDVEAVVMIYKAREIVIATKKQREAVLRYFNNNRE